MKEFTVSENSGYRLSGKIWKAISPSNLNALELTHDCKDDKGEIVYSSTCQFFMTDEELSTLAERLTA